MKNSAIKKTVMVEFGECQRKISNPQKAVEMCPQKIFRAGPCRGCRSMPFQKLKEIVISQSHILPNPSHGNQALIK